MNKTIKVCEIFKGIQGEGRYCGLPVLFIRLSGCTQDCSFCDSSYHKKGIEMSYYEVIKKIKESRLGCICWTGGEPLVQRSSIMEIITQTSKHKHYLETNGDLLVENDLYIFDYIAISPKNLALVKKWKKDFTFTNKKYEQSKFDIKIATDLKVNKELVPYSTMLMPLTTYDEKKDEEIRKKVWQYCLDYNLRYSPRLQVEIWGKKRKI